MGAGAKIWFQHIQNFLSKQFFALLLRFKFSLKFTVFFTWIFFEYPATKSWLLQPHHGSCSNIMAPAAKYWLLQPYIRTWSYILQASKLLAQMGEGECCSKRGGKGERGEKGRELKEGSGHREGGEECREGGQSGEKERGESGEWGRWEQGEWGEG